MRSVFHHLTVRMDAGNLFAQENEAFFNWVEMEKEDCKISIQTCNFGYFPHSNNLTVEWGTNFQVIVLSLTQKHALQSLHSDRTNANITNTQHLPGVQLYWL